jgi:hypothetical protein
MSLEEKSNVYTHEGAIATTPPTNKEQLKRLVLCNLLFEDTFYENGIESSIIMANLIKKMDAEEVAEIAIQARDEMYIRHTPLFMIKELCKKKPIPSKLIRKTLAHIIQRPDEFGEFISLYWKDGKKMLPHSVQKAFSDAFNKFNEYSFAKYQGKKNPIKLRDALFLSHAKPSDEKKADLFKKIANKKLEVADTWESNLSSGKDKKETFERLLREGKLGGLATLRNLRNMKFSGVDYNLIKERLENGSFEKIFPYRFITASKYTARFSGSLEKAMFKSISQMEKLNGKTLIVLDVSGSMKYKISKKTNVKRIDAGASVMIIARELCHDSTMYITGNKTILVPSHLRGFSIHSFISKNEAGYGGIYLVRCLDHISKMEQENYDRVIVFTDEQDCGGFEEKPENAKKLGKYNYIINVASYKNGIGYKNGWHTISGYSENIFKYITEYEKVTIS